MQKQQSYVIKKYVKWLFILTFIVFLFMYLLYGFSHYVTGVCFLISFVTGVSFLMREYTTYLDH